MMLRKSTVVTLSILVSVATALPYSEWDHARYRWNDLFAARGQEIAARIRSQATIEPSSCATITETMVGKSYRVRVCTADPEDFPNNVCVGTRVNPCCSTADFGKGNLVSSNKVNVAGEDVTVAYYLTQDPTAKICFRLDDAHLRSETCSQSRNEDFPCLPPCLAITTTCFNNTETGDSSSCDGNVCRCKTGYLPPDCCQCDTTNFYLPDCRPFCRDNCRLFRPNNLGGCLTCRAGYTGAPECCECEPGKTEVNGVCKCNANLNPDGTCAEGSLEPDCCECDTTGNATHAFYKTPSGECKPFCHNNCASNVGFGCDTCKTGFMSPPECCQCEPGREEVDGICKCRANLKPDGTCAEGALAPDCCECDTAGNATHAFYRTPAGECKPFCKNNCAVTGSSGCITCKTGYIGAPECCECDTAGNATHAFYKTPSGECKPFCKNNCAVTGSSGCITCKTGYIGAPECCECDTAGNATHAFYRTPAGECKPFCKNNCASSVGFGCNTCKTGFMSPPECCQCEPGREEVDGICKCRANLKPDGTCAEGALAPDCCECDTTGNATHAFYKTPSGECIPFCQSNCAEIGTSGCVTCKTGFITVPECCQCEPDREEVNGICKCSANLNPDGSCIPEAKPEDCCECITGYQKGPSGRCEPEKCDKQQNLFFYIDATASNIYENFCPLMVVLQMLVAAFNPSTTSGTQIASLLFSDNVKNKPPSPVFNMNTPCFTAVQGPDKSLKSLMIDFGVCLDSGRTGYDSVTFPSSCGEGTSAVKGLREIYNIASTTRSSIEGAILMLTDGIILDNDSERTKVLSDLTSAGISTLIAAGIGEADVENLKLYTSDSNILVGNDPIQLGIDIVNKMQERGIVCKDHADNITRSLNNAQGGDLISLFCRCHRKQYIGRDICQRKYPICGGDLSIGLPNLPGSRSKMQDAEALEYVNQLLMEEEILAAVEKVLEQRHYG